MASRKIKAAIVYDFDGTLSPGNMQEYGFIPSAKVDSKTFWSEVTKESHDHQADNILFYMKHMIDVADRQKIKIHRESFTNFGKRVTLFEGVEEWFDYINGKVKALGIDLHHFVVSSGLKEMIEGTTIASKFDKIYASNYYYDHNGIAKWPALAVNYTTKTQFLFRINKNAPDVSNSSSVNDFIPHDQREYPFTHMIYVGDGETDIPSMRLVKEQGGYSIAVFHPKKRLSDKKRGELKSLLKDGRVHAVVPAVYSQDSEIDDLVSAILTKIAGEAKLNSKLKTLKNKRRNLRLD